MIMIEKKWSINDSILNLKFKIWKLNLKILINFKLGVGHFTFDGRH